MSEANPARNRTRRALEGLERVRNEPRIHVLALGVAAIIGLAVASVHWFGLVLGGILLGFVSPTLPRAFGYAIAFGAVVSIAFVLTLGSSAWLLLEMTPIVYITAGSAFGLPAFGSLVRGLA
ncbi:hypothetical protein [Halostagnicola sp. A-GB9-2]|uniref:hypothetical protein n=1 Tax=Halostagnicola sp. A-GB9-2 TaxID=3048066 RepID=UPI0024C03798|nr:hypothetical protein [Halostagnicola sp. A-GB9-2]MDJ1430474.1 hypothetical protein [Halostagnicola sp. A-GB9-2]